MRRLLPLVMLVSLAASLAPCEQAHADLLMNGDFSTAGTGTDAFASWTSTSQDTPTDGGGFAKFTNSANGLFVDLLQSFEIPTNSHSLSFEFKASIIAAAPSNAVPDNFQATLYDRLHKPFPTPSDPAFPAFYSIDIKAGGLETFDHQIVSVSQVQVGNDLWSRVTLDLSTLALPQMDARLVFTLQNGNDASQISEVDLDNVEIHATQVVPEPSTLIPVGLGLIGFIAYGCRPRTIRA